MDEYDTPMQEAFVDGYWDELVAFTRNLFNSTHKDIYNPWSILNFLDKGYFTTYWANTSANSLVGKLIREGNRGVKEKFESLLLGESIRTPIDEQIIYNQLDHNEDAVWSLLLARAT